MNAEGTFTGRSAPCGQITDGESFEDRDHEVVVTRELDFKCGCTSIQREYHDGSVSRKVVHHNGRVLVDELLSAE